MGRVTNLFEMLDREDYANRKCRDCGHCLDRTETQGLCSYFWKRVAYVEPATKCSYFHASRLRARSEAECDEAPKYGRLKVVSTGLS